MSVGSATWQDAPLIGMGTSSSPTSAASMPMGSGFPSYSAWWKIHATEDLGLIIDSNQTEPLSTGVDTVMTVYAEADLLAEPDPDQASYLKVDDDGGTGGRSKAELTITAGDTYYVRLGTYSNSIPSSDTLYVLSLNGYRFTAWMDTGRTKSDTNTSFFGTYYQGATVLRILPGDTFDLAVLTDAMNEARLTTTQGSSVVTDTGFSLAIDARRVDDHGDPSLPDIEAVGSITEVQINASLPSRYWPTSAFADLAPSDSLGTEIDNGGAGTVLSALLHYDVTDTSYDASASVPGTGTGTEPSAQGSWAFNLTNTNHPTETVTIQGAARNTVSSGDLTLSPETAADGTAAIRATVTQMTPEPLNPSFPLGSYMRIGAVVDIATSQTTRAPRVRFKIPLAASAGVSWWDGAAIQPATVRGWWDGSTVQAVTLRGWWDGTTIQPIIGGG